MRGCLTHSGDDAKNSIEGGIGPTFKGVVTAWGWTRIYRFTPQVQDAMVMELHRTGAKSQWVGPNDYATPQERATVKEMQGF